MSALQEKVQKTLRDNPTARWTALIIVSFTMFGAYFFNYVLSPIKPLLESALGWTSKDFGIYTGSYSFFNVFFFMLIISGFILDKFGIRITGLGATALMTLGTAIDYFAIITPFPDNATIFGLNEQVFIAALGFAIFGVGTEAGGITVSKAIVKWFKGKEMALAMGLQMSIARMGTALALAISLPLAKHFTISTPILLALIFMIISFMAFLYYITMDIKIDKQLKEIQTEEEEPFKIKDIVYIITNRGFWYIAILCVLFYSAVFPFLFYATDLMVNKYFVNPSFAGLIPALLPLGTILLTPLFGGVYDKKGKGATIMIIGAILLIIVHGLLAIPSLNAWWIAALLVIVLGIAFSLVPAAMWPSVPKIIPEKRLGTAYAVIFWIQNIGLMLVPILLGFALDKANPDVAPNKDMIRKAIESAYTQTVANNNYLKPKYLRVAIEKSSSSLVDSVVEFSSYKALPNSKVDTSVVHKAIYQKTLQVLKNFNYDKYKKADQKDRMLALVNAVRDADYPIIIKYKLNVRYDYTVVELIFTLLGILSLIFAFLLKHEDKIKGYGLELPNIEEELEKVKKAQAAEAESEADAIK